VNRGLWQKITETFDAALEYPPGERESYLERACGSDKTLFCEVVRLLAEFEKAGDFIEQPLVESRQSVTAGALIGKRYRIEALLGRGGMGEVYRAQDEFMNERVALKVLRSELTGDRGIIHRFQREVQLARKVTHRNVCRVFDAGVHTDGDQSVYFFTMQLLEGETLAAHIRRVGPIPRNEAFPLAQQMAEGLSAAHQAGVIHRDFKSANVILCDGKALITDFGLARLEPGKGNPVAVGTITANSQIAGTIAYMSPEQLCGGEMTAASDIYSFGVVLFEVATARLPFDDRHIIQSAMQRASDSTLNVRALAPTIDPRWASVIKRCLQRDPSKRFQSALEAATELQPNLWRPPMPNWTRRQWNIGVVAGLSAAGLSAAGVALISTVSRFHSQNARLPEGADALLSPITNSTGDARFDGITELFRNQLSQSVHLNLIDSAKVAGELRQMGKPENTADPAAIREAAWRLNAGLALYGEVSRIGTDYVLNIEIEARGPQPDRPRAKPHNSWTASDPDALMRTIGDASIWVRETVGESPASVTSFDRLPADTTTPSWQALSYYARGQNFFMHQDYDPALLEFESALRADPKFTLAALRRADLLVSRGRQAEGFPQYRAAIHMLDERPVTRAEELNARGIFAFDSGDVEASDKYFRTWSAEYPSDWKPSYYRIIGLILEGYARQALQMLAALRRRMPDFGDLYAQTIAALLVLGETAQARTFVPQLRKWNGAERGDLREGFVRFREGDCLGYLSILHSIQRSQNWRAASDAMLNEAMLYIDASLPDAITSHIDDFLSAHSGAETVPEQASLRAVQAWTEMRIGQIRSSISHARQALELEPGPLIVAVAGTVFARGREGTLARRALEFSGGMLDIRLYAIAYHRIAGELANASGNQELAIREFRAAAALEPRIAHRQYLMEALPVGPERLALCLNAVRIPWQALRPPPMHSLGSLGFAVPVVNSTSGIDEPFARKFAVSSRQLENAS